MEGSSQPSPRPRQSSWTSPPAPAPRPRRRPRPASPRETHSLGGLSDQARRARPREAWSEGGPVGGCGHCARCRHPDAGEPWAGPRRPGSARGDCDGGEALRQQLQNGLQEALASTRGQELVALVLSRLQKAQRLRELQNQAAAAWEDLQRSDRRVRRSLERERRLLLQQSREPWQHASPRKARGNRTRSDGGDPERRARAQSDCRDPAPPEQWGARTEPGKPRCAEPSRPSLRSPGNLRGEPPRAGKGPQPSLSSQVNYEARRVLKDCQAKAEELLRKLALEQRAPEEHPQTPETERRSSGRGHEPEEQRRGRHARGGQHRAPRDKALQLRQFGLLRERAQHFLRPRGEREDRSHVEGIKEALRRREQEGTHRARDDGRATPGTQHSRAPSSSSLETLLLETQRRSCLQRGGY